MGIVYYGNYLTYFEVGRVEYLRGLGKLGKKFALILDVDRVLSADDLRVATSLDAPAEAPDADAERSSLADGEASPGEPGLGGAA